MQVGRLHISHILYFLKIKVATFTYNVSNGDLQMKVITIEKMATLERKQRGKIEHNAASHIATRYSGKSLKFARLSPDQL